MINLEHLTEEERKIIMDVLQRDEQLRQSEQERVKKLKTELHELRKKSAVKVDDDSVDSGKKVCARCREPLGTIFNSGEVCPRCQHKVCSNCKVVLPNSKKWLCTICNKQLQIRLESGEAFGPKREGQPGAYGTELIKISLGQSKTVLDPNIQVNGGPQSPADSGFHGRGANVPSVGGSTTFDEDYPSDLSYEQSMVSGVESIGPSVSQRGSIARHSHGAPMNHDDNTIVRNDVEGGMYGSADITMERVSPSTTRRSRQSDPKYNASESGIKSFHSGYTNINIEKGEVPLPLPNSYSKIDNQTSAVQSSSNKSLQSKFPFITQSHKSILLSGKEPRYDLSMDVVSVDKIDDRQVYTTNIYSPRKIVPLVSKEGQDIAPSFKTSAQSKVLNTPPLSNTTTSSALLTNPHVGSSRFPAHVTNKRHANVGDFTKPTSNSYEYDTVSSDRVYLSSGVYDFQDQSVSDTVDDTAGEESSRQSDTDTQSITSSSTVAWDTLTDTKEMDSKKTTSSSEIDGQCVDSSESSGCLLQENNLTKATLHQHGSTVASSGYESASSLSLSSEASLKTNSKTSNVSSFGSDLRRILMNERLTISLKDDYPSLQYFSYDSSPNDYVILEEEEILSQLRLSERIAPDLVPNMENNNEDEPSRYDSVKSVCKDMPLADILYLQQQGSLLQNAQSEHCDDMAKTSAPTDSISHEQHLGSEEKLAKTNQSVEDSIPNESQQHGKVSDVQLSIHDLGSINSHYVTDLVDDDESSDCSSIDISNLDFSDSSESDTNLNHDQDNKRRVLKVGGKIATFEDSERDKSVSEWGLSDDKDGLVPLVLPGLSSGSELSVKDKGAASGDDSDTFMASLLKRLIRTPRTPQQPSPSYHKPLVSDDEDEDAFKRFSESLDISSDSDSLDETHLEFDPSLIADSSEEKEACFKSKLDHNKALMRLLIKDLSTDDEQTLSEKEQTGQRKSGPLSQNSSSLAEQSPSASASQTPEKTIGKQSKQPSKNSFAVELSGNSKPRRKKRGKSKSKLDDAEASVGYASKKGLMRQSKTQFGVLSSTPDGKTQLYTLGEDKNRAESPVNLSKGRYTPLKDTGGPQPLDRPTTPYVCQSLPQPRIHRKQPSSPGLPRSHDDNDSSSSSSSCEEDEEEDNHDEIDSSSSRPFSPNTITRPFSFAGDDSSDGELSVIMEEPEDLDAELEQSYDSKL